MAVVATIGGLYLARPALAPVAIVLGLWFGGWLWGVAGVVLAVPVLVAAKSIAVELERTRGSPPPE
jgi:predicted PurR-regulated permease PerM